MISVDDRKHPRALGLVLTLVLACGPAALEGVPPSLAGLTPLCHVLADATWVKAVDNPAAGDNAAAQFSGLEVLWSTTSMVLGDGLTYEVPAVPEPLEAWGFFQNIDQYETGDQLTLCLSFSEDHPYGQWRVTFALTGEGLALPAADSPEKNPGSVNLAVDLEKLEVVAAARNEDPLQTLIALVQEQRLWSDSRNLGDPLSERPIASEFIEEIVPPTDEEKLAAWRSIPPEVRSLMPGTGVPEGHGLTFSPMHFALIADPELASEFDGVRFITNEGFVLTHILPLNYAVQPLSEFTVQGLDIRVALYVSPKGEGEVETLVDVGTIEWKTLEPATPLLIEIHKDSMELTPMSQDEYDALLLDPGPILGHAD
ncbi:MAG: hypothetical protein ACR2NT_10610 [Acidimicrobiia bacterium]|nr:hypothetical protein [Acidimicrobiia bacterium]